MTFGCGATLVALVVLKLERFTPALQGMLFSVFVLVPPFVSCMNPVMFTILTPGYGKSSLNFWRTLVRRADTLQSLSGQSYKVPEVPATHRVLMMLSPRKVEE